MTSSRLGLLEVEEASKCSYCYRLMRQEVYSCTNGHRGCEFCVIRLECCPVCQVSFVEQSSDNRKVHLFRDHEFEKILNTLEFPCVWKDRGCTSAMYRWNVGLHQAECRFNNESFRVCLLFSDVQNLLRYRCPKWCPIECADPRLREKLIRHMLNYHRVPFFVINIGEQVEYNLQPLHPNSRNSCFYYHTAPKKTVPWKENQVLYFADIIIEVPVVHSDKCTVFYGYILVSRHKFHSNQQSDLSWTLVAITPESELLPRFNMHSDSCDPQTSGVPKPKFSLSFQHCTTLTNSRELVLSVTDHNSHNSGQSPSCNVPTIGFVKFKEIVASSISGKHSAVADNYFSTGIQIKREFKMDWNGERVTWDFERIENDAHYFTRNKSIKINIPIRDVVAVGAKYTDIVAKQRPCACNTTKFEFEAKQINPGSTHVTK